MSTNSEKTLITSKFGLDANKAIVDGGSVVVSLYVIDNFMKSYFPAAYGELLTVGITSASALTVISPLITNVREGRSPLAGINFDKKLFVDMMKYGALTWGIYYLLRMFVPTITNTTLKRYAIIIGSTIGARMTLPKLENLMPSNSPQ
jgi:hypothetical protein